MGLCDDLEEWDGGDRETKVKGTYVYIYIYI